jgi:hypothetical protein
MGFGGPVWHASARAATEPTAWAIAGRALLNVGDGKLGEWREVGNNGVVHLRRRMSDAERAALGGLEVRDIRNKREEYERLAALFADAPYLRSLT